MTCTCTCCCWLLQIAHWSSCRLTLRIVCARHRPTCEQTSSRAASISGGDKNGPFGKLFSRSLAMSAPSASTVTQPRSAAAKAARGRGRVACISHHFCIAKQEASSWSPPRSTTSCAPCRATTTMRTRAVSTPRLHVSSQCLSQTNKCTHHISVRALIAFIS